MLLQDQKINPEMVIANRYKYCKICGFTCLINGRHPKQAKRTPTWSKIAWLIHYLNLFDTVVWLDYDAIILKPDCNWVNMNYDFNIAKDRNYDRYNAGVLVTKPPAIPFLESVWNHSDFGKGKSDQRSINYMLRKKNYDFGILEKKYNDFPTPPRACPGYRPPKYRAHNQSTTIIRHRAGQFSGARTSDGKILKCAYDQIDFQKEAYEIYKYNYKNSKTLKNVAVLTVIT